MKYIAKHFDIFDEEIPISVSKRPFLAQLHQTLNSIKVQETTSHNKILMEECFYRIKVH